MGVEGGGGVVEGFLKYVSNYNREFYKTGLGLVGGLYYFEQNEEVRVLDEVHLEKKKNPFSEVLETSAATSDQLMMEYLLLNQLGNIWSLDECLKD